MVYHLQLQIYDTVEKNESGRFALQSGGELPSTVVEPQHQQPEIVHQQQQP